MKIEFTHWRLPAQMLNYEYRKRGEPSSDALIEYSKGNGFYVSNPGSEIYKFDGVTPHPRGGKTVCRIIDDSDKQDKLVIVAIGVAVCSMSDNFSYKRGRDIAYGRASRAAKNYAVLEEFTA